MSRNFTVLQSVGSGTIVPPRAACAPDEAGRYADLLRRLFNSPSAVAIVGSGIGSKCADVCYEIASELGAAGKRVVVVQVDRLLRMDPLTVLDETALVPGGAPNIWLWPAAAGHTIEFFKSRSAVGEGNWLDYLRESVDSILLDCPEVRVGSGVTEIAAMADATVLVVEAGRSTGQKILVDQHALQLSGAKLVGCILIEGK